MLYCTTQQYDGTFFSYYSWSKTGIPTITCSIQYLSGTNHTLYVSQEDYICWLKGKKHS